MRLDKVGTQFLPNISTENQAAVLDELTHVANDGPHGLISRKGTRIAPDMAKVSPLTIRVNLRST